MEKTVKFSDIKSEFDKAITNEECTIDLFGQNVSVKSTLGFGETIQLVETVAASCFTEDGEYIPEVLDFNKRVQIIEFFTDFELPDDIEERFSLLYHTDFVYDVIECIDAGILNHIDDSVDAKIAYIIRKNESELRAEVERAMTGLQVLSESVRQMTETLTPDVVNELLTALDKNTKDRSQLIAAYSAKVDKETNKEE